MADTIVKIVDGKTVVTIAGADLLAPLVAATQTAATAASSAATSVAAKAYEIANATARTKAAQPKPFLKPIDVVLGLGQSNRADERAYAGGDPQMTELNPLLLAANGGWSNKRLTGVSANDNVFVAPGSDFQTLVTLTPRAGFGTKGEGTGLQIDAVPVLYMASARGGSDYTELRKGRAIYTNGIGWLKYMNLVACPAAGYYIRHVFIHGPDQGENDADSLAAGGGAGSPTSHDVYKGYRREWIADVRADIARAIRRPGYVAPVFWSNIGLPGGPAVRDIQNAISEVAEEIDGVFQIGPWYGVLPYIDSDRTHQTAVGQVLAGEQYWIATKRWITGDRRQPSVKMLWFARNGATVRIKCRTVVGPLVIDTSNGDATGFPDQAQANGGRYGLQYIYSGTAVAISAVAVDGDVITLTLAADPGPVLAIGSEEVRAAQQTAIGGNAAVPTAVPRTNIRDSWSSKSRFPGLSYTHYNWLVAGRCLRG